MPPRRRGLSRKRLLLIILIVGAVLVVTGAGTAFFLYNRATEVNRGTPTVAVHQFLSAVFVERDDNRTKLFTCSEWTKQRSDEARARFDPEVKVKWADVTQQSRNGKQAVVTAQLQLLWQGFADFQQWRFDVVEDNGWRVCGAGPA
jgi:flagellar basal body-associated protein FliL